MPSLCWHTFERGKSESLSYVQELYSPQPGTGFVHVAAKNITCEHLFTHSLTSEHAVSEFLWMRTNIHDRTRKEAVSSDLFTGAVNLQLGTVIILSALESFSAVVIMKCFVLNLWRPTKQTRFFQREVRVCSRPQNNTGHAIVCRNCLSAPSSGKPSAVESIALPITRPELYSRPQKAISPRGPYYFMVDCIRTSTPCPAYAWFTLLRAYIHVRAATS